MLRFLGVAVKSSTKQGVKIGEHFYTQLGSGMVALVHDHQWIELVDDLKQRRFIRILNGVFRRAQHFGKGGKIAVLLIGF